DRGGGGVADPPDPGLDGGQEQVQGAGDVDLVGGAGVGHRAGHRGQGGQVVDDLGPGHGLGPGRRVAEVALQHLEVAVDAVEVGRLAGGEVVQHPDGVAVGDERADEAGPDEAVPAGDQDVHRAPVAWVSAMAAG